MYNLGLCPPVGNIMENQRERKKQRLENAEIEKEMDEYNQERRKCLKLLLLGSGESGKSTIFKQMKLMHEKITDDDYIKVKPIIYSNVLTAMGNILLNMERLGICFEEPRRQEDKETVLDVVYHDDEVNHFTADVYVSLVLLWMDSGVQECYERRNEYQLADCTKYFFDRLHHLHSCDYVPTTQDLLYARKATTRIVHLNLSINNVELKVIDVGGQRTERRKWIHCFDDVRCVIFITAISEFNQMMRLDNTSNRLLDSLSLFHELLNMAYFDKASIVLFLNKIDLFREKIESHVSIRTLFKDYNGKNTYDESLHYIEMKFISNHKSRVYSHSTCATDTNQVQKIVRSCEDMVIDKNTEKSGLE